MEAAEAQPRANAVHDNGRIAVEKPALLLVCRLLEPLAVGTIHAT
jgi:hypothetical protein